jgi:hypothetical protein
VHSRSPDGTWEARKSAIWPPLGDSFAWRADVRRIDDDEAGWRLVYLGPASEPATNQSVTWLDGESILIAGRRIAVAGEAYDVGWLTTGEGLVVL